MKSSEMNERRGQTTAVRVVSLLAMGVAWSRWRAEDTNGYGQEFESPEKKEPICLGRFLSIH